MPIQSFSSRSAGVPAATPINPAVAGVFAVAVLLGLPAAAQAGMPSVNLSDLGRMKLDTISFFAAGFLASAWGIQRVWNALQGDFPRIPRLTFKAAAGVVFLWGMLFVLVLTMISGARELMTPGAWAKQGLTYKLAGAKDAVSEEGAANRGEPQDALAQRREQQLQKLYVALMHYAARHDGQLPPIAEMDAIGSDHWHVPDRLGTRYLYVPGRSLEKREAIVAYEPQVYDDRQLVLRADGRVQRMSVEELQSALETGSTP